MERLGKEAEEVQATYQASGHRVPSSALASKTREVREKCWLVYLFSVCPRLSLSYQDTGS